MGNSKSYYNTSGKALGARSVEYESINKAAAEIIDNSIEAGADKIYIILESGTDEISGKTITSKIYFIDNGCGMTSEELQEYVRDGSSSKVDFGTMGKFGVGMNQASLFATPRFEVISWRSNLCAYKQVIDSREMQINPNFSVEPSLEIDLPPEFIQESSFKEHGTCIIWCEVDKGNKFRPITVAERMSTDIGRIFRKYIVEKNIKIFLSTDWKNPYECKPRDPLMLQEVDYFLGDTNGKPQKEQNGEPLFINYEGEGFVNGEKKIQIPYLDENNIVKYSFVKLQGSYIKEKFYWDAALKNGYKQPGDTEIGKYLKELAKGITVLRASREIDFNYFDFYDSINQPQDRWFKIQISFERELDSVFGVSNNKQHIELKHVSSKSAIALDEDVPYYPIWLRLKSEVDKMLSNMRKRNKELVKVAKNTSEVNEFKESSTSNSHLSNSDEKYREYLKNEVGITLNVFEKKTEEYEELIINNTSILLSFEDIFEPYRVTFLAIEQKNKIILNKTLFKDKKNFDFKILLVALLLESTKHAGYSETKKSLDNILKIYLKQSANFKELK